MRKFRLKKKYPGSPELGETRTGSEENCRCYPTEKCMKNNPEFWEEIKEEQDYEIILTKHPDGKPHEMLADCDEEGCKIYQIRRVKDGEIFTIGDKINILNPIESYNNLRIRGFSIDNLGNLLVSTTNKVDRAFYMGKGCNISIVEKAKQLLFISQDNKEIFEGDEFWFINKNLNYPPDKSKNYCNDSHVLYFSSKKAAENYILYNKPCLSLNDVAEIYPGVNKSHPNMPSHQAERLKKLVKQRL